MSSSVLPRNLHDGVGGLMAGIGMIANTVQAELHRAGSSQAPLMTITATPMTAIGTPSISVPISSC